MFHSCGVSRRRWTSSHRSESNKTLAQRQPSDEMTGRFTPRYGSRSGRGGCLPAASIPDGPLILGLPSSIASSRSLVSVPLDLRCRASRQVRGGETRRESRRLSGYETSRSARAGHLTGSSVHRSILMDGEPGLWCAAALLPAPLAHSAPSQNTLGSTELLSQRRKAARLWKSC